MTEYRLSYCRSVFDRFHQLNVVERLKSQGDSSKPQLHDGTKNFNSHTGGKFSASKNLNTVGTPNKGKLIFLQKWVE